MKIESFQNDCLVLLKQLSHIKFMGFRVRRGVSFKWFDILLIRYWIIRVVQRAIVTILAVQIILHNCLNSLIIPAGSTLCQSYKDSHQREVYIWTALVYNQKLLSNAWFHKI